MEKAIKNCIDDFFNKNDISNLLHRISFGFDDSANCIFFNCSKEKLLYKKYQLIIEFSNQGIWSNIICDQFKINENDLTKILNKSKLNKDQKNNDKLKEEFKLLEKKNYFEKK